MCEDKDMEGMMCDYGDTAGGRKIEGGVDSLSCLFWRVALYIIFGKDV